MPISRQNRFKSTVREQNQVLKYDLNSYEETLAISMSVCKNVGIRLYRKDSNFRRFWWNVFYWVQFVNVFVAIWLELINLIQTAMDGSFMDLFRMLPCIGYMILALAKSYKIVYFRPVFEDLLSELRTMWPQQEVLQVEHRILSKALKQLRYISKGYYWCNIALVITFTCWPYIQLVKRLAGKDVPLILSFFYWLPFDPFQRGCYEILLILQTWHCIITIWFMLAGDLLFFVVLSHITTHFDLLSVRISNFFEVPVDKQLVQSYPLAEHAKSHLKLNGETMNVDARESTQQMEIKYIIKQHQTLISSQRVSEAFGRHKNFRPFRWSLSTLPICIGAVLLYALSLFNYEKILELAFVEKWSEIEYKTFLMTATAQIWLLCWYGQRLIDASNGISDAVYNSGWYLSSHKMRKHILIIIHRSQFKLCITTYGFSAVSFASFSAIIKTSWSYFTLLINMYK